MFISPLWRPDPAAAAASQMNQFRLWVNQRYSLHLSNYFDLHRWSVTHAGDFWEAVWFFMAVIAEHPPHKIFSPGKRMQESQWFTGATLNFAENLLRYRDDKPALIFHSEMGKTRTLTYQDLFAQVAALMHWMREIGVSANDRVAGFLPNCPETVIAMLATTGLGAIWSACSSDFGLQGLVDRFSQIEPKILFAADAHTYSGKVFSHLEQIQALQQALPSLQQTVVLPFINSSPDLKALSASTQLWMDCMMSSRDLIAGSFKPFPFSHPVYILYSSGTTGKPKCMVHGAGGTLLQHLKELRLHTNLSRDDTIFFYTTCTWMMWHWLVSSLAVGATVVLYEGNPYYPHDAALYDLIDQDGVTVFGVGAKYIEMSEEKGLSLKQSHALKSLRTILTTGSPLLPHSFDFVYQQIKSDVCLSSISGGSDIISCFALGNPTLPVYRGELQCLGLGMDVRILNDEGLEIQQEKGELVCGAPFPSMPVCFWNDSNGEKYQRAYFDKFPGFWAHGDYAALTEHSGLIIYGRSDATLNPGGIRIGPAEIYEQLKQFPAIGDCLAVAYSDRGQEKMILFVTMLQEKNLTPELIHEIKTALRKNLSPHHVPSQIIQAPDLPRTINGKLMETLVKKIINHEPFNPPETLANPDCLKFFEQWNFNN